MVLSSWCPSQHTHTLTMPISSTGLENFYVFLFPGWTDCCFTNRNLHIGWSRYSNGGCHESWEILRIFPILLKWQWPCKVANSSGPTRIYCSNYPSIGEYCPIALAGSATRWIYSFDTNIMQQWCVFYAQDIFQPNIRRRDTYSWDGLIHLGDWMKSWPFPPSLAWQSFSHQLQPGMMCGLATVVLSPHTLLEQIQRVYFKYLPLLNVNCHIDLLWRLIPERYQGLGMANYALVSLALKLSFL